MKNKLLKKKKWIKLWSFIFICLLFGINTYAWFLYLNTVTSGIDTKVVEWDIIYADDEDNQINEINIQIDKMYPGMISTKKTYVIKNNSDLDAILEYKLKSIRLFNDTFVLDEDYTNEEALEEFLNNMPFSISFIPEDTDISKKTQISFDIEIKWDFESDKEYLKVNKFYKFLDSMEYYTKDGSNYEKVNVNASNYDSLVTSGLYLKADFADTYWGEMSTLYNNGDTSKKSLDINLELLVKQA